MTGRQRPASTATAALWPVLAVPLLGLGLAGCGAVLLRLHEPAADAATSLGLAAAGLGCALVLLWCAASALALGAGWVSLEDQGVEHVVPLVSVLWWERLGRGWAPHEDPVAGRLGLAHALRALARARARVRIRLAGEGPQAVLEGTVDAVGRDFLDLALYPDDDYRRRESVTAVRTVPFHAVLCVSSLAGP